MAAALQSYRETQSTRVAAKAADTNLHARILDLLARV